VAERPRFDAVQRAFARHLRDPEHAPPPDDVEPRRMKVYRELFFNNLSSLLAGTFPVLHAILGPTRWSALVRDFMVRHEARTPLFTEVPQELLRFLQETRRDAPDDPPFMLELAHYEWVELALQLAPDPPAADVDPMGDLLAGVPVVSPLAWPVAYDWPVHRLSVEHQPATPPTQPTFLVVYRDRDDAVRFMEINALTARLLELAGAEGAERCGRDLLSGIAQELGHPDAGAVIGGGAQTLAMLRDHGVLLGVRR
jgi:hypothetical protein